MKKHFLIVAAVLITVSATAQNKEEEVKEKGFKKEKLFTGGSVSLSISDHYFLGGVNPVIGYDLAKWVDAGIAINYIHTSQRDYYSSAKLRQNLYGAGLFTRIYPVRFLFAQGQLEQNFIRNKFIPGNSGAQSYTQHAAATSFLVGAGYTTGRYPGSGSTYGYFAVLFDVLDDPDSPYRAFDNDPSNPYSTGTTHAIPIIRAGINIPLFQGKNKR